jgi:hypothetical protein
MKKGVTQLFASLENVVSPEGFHRRSPEIPQKVNTKSGASEKVLSKIFNVAAPLSAIYLNVSSIRGL